MADEIQIRTVTAEFLRAGPPHNQLLSPLTQYLAVCGDAGAGVVTVPYEHAAFERRLKELRYESGAPDDRIAMLHDVGVDMGRILGSVPGLPGALTVDPNHPGTLIHLRLTLSASELAHLPFELAKVPVGGGATTESWLAIQTRPPVCLTRNIRTVSPEGVLWPHKPRILFVAGDPHTVPFDAHRDELVQAIAPFRYPGRDDPSLSRQGAREQFGDLLTILKNPTLADVMLECRSASYTHIHVLTHGDEASRDDYGLVLRDDDGAPDVVSGERFASALTAVGRDAIRRPAAVTVASCDSANIGTVTIPGASFAHALHQAGIPLVVASQFPLSMEGSIPLGATLYQGLLWGEHPLILMQRLRAELHARYTSTWHDWASLVVYEALPQALGAQLDKLRYFQTRCAMDAALERIDRAVQAEAAAPALDDALQSGRAASGSASLAELDAAVERAVERLPLTGQYAVECLGLRASARKRLAQAAFVLGAREPAQGGERWRDPYDLLEQAWIDYDESVRRLLVNDGTTVQRVATLHWLLVQAVCLAAVLGRDDADERWKAAKLCADLYSSHAELEERAWAHASLAELYLLKLAQWDLGEAERQGFAERALDHANRLIDALPSRCEFPVTSTLRQFQRYARWWGDAHFEEGLSRRRPCRRPSWAALVKTAEDLVGMLERGASSEPGRGPAPPSPPPEAMPGGSAPTAPNGAGPDAREKSESGALTKPAGKPGVPAPSGRRKRRDAAFFDIEMLPAGHGDALWIEYGDANASHRWLVDCGTQQTATHLMRRVDDLPTGERSLELFVLSHIDADHIGGALPFFRAVQQGLRFGDVWFNGWRHLSGRLTARQGEMFSTAIQDFELPWNAWRDGDAIVIDDGPLPVQELPGGMKLTLLSPMRQQLKRLAPVWTRELKRYGLEPGSRVDYTRFLKGTPSTSTDVDELAAVPFSSDAGVPNGTSIALLAEYRGAAALLGADAHAPVLAASIERLLRERGLDRLRADVFKLAHHGSRNNISADLLRLLDCRHYLLSSNGDHFCHPDREAIARIIKFGGERPSLHFNYKSRYNEVWARPDLQEKYSYAARFPAADALGLSVSLMALHA
jgi:beta-lactamase superfamily II metal-dependent hydrolase